jgi:hypothetical protein
MRIGQKIRRAITGSALAAAAVTAGLVVPASPAAARPIDCSLAVGVHQISVGLEGRAKVYCSQPEHYTVHVSLFREDGWFDGLVATGIGRSNGRAGSVFAFAVEPCSDVQTNKTYYARGRVEDTTYYYPIEVKVAVSSSVWGHC